MVEGLNTDVYDANGESPLAHIWTALHFGDYMAYYLAMAYEVDPTPVDALQTLKAAMKAASKNKCRCNEPVLCTTAKVVFALPMSEDRYLFRQR